jgi:hypothetical protein
MAVRDAARPANAVAETPSRGQPGRCRHGRGTVPETCRPEPRPGLTWTWPLRTEDDLEGGAAAGDGAEREGAADRGGALAHVEQAPGATVHAAGKTVQTGAGGAASLGMLAHHTAIAVSAPGYAPASAVSPSSKSHERCLDEIGQRREVVAALEHRGDARRQRGGASRKLRENACRQLQLGERVVGVGVEAGRDEQ